MSINYNPKFIVDNLLLYLDAGNLKKSYSGSGTTWYDVSGRSNTASMYGTAPFSSDGGGCFDFSSVTGATSGAASMGFTFSSNMIPTTGSFTLNCWIKNPPTSVGQCGMFSNAGGADGYRYGIGKDAVYVLNSGAGGVGYSEPTLSFSSTLSASLWYNVVTIFDRAAATPQWRLWLNGEYQTATNMAAGANTAFTNSTPGLIRSACCTLYTGKLAIFTAHSGALTPSNIQGNFQALRGRFGV